ncbi:protein of unknown function [Streptococcus thermophilus]|uniref:Uncharacterized protein n=1 Tax=Streptococcus thermophilus TaxID=1308 RepID=A0A8D6XR23_STRTR|nr:protein of unknown function [Streptococcus thermophilus]CAD0143649.1 protein of unknown function [Streptococcus thermophilus]CAD0143694.1 protein of unknown function [Streptococcus thermophilus]CAD0151534.1 protein of unknown function [Streptococcus thermophilus]
MIEIRSYDGPKNNEDGQNSLGHFRFDHQTISDDQNTNG